MRIRARATFTSDSVDAFAYLQERNPAVAAALLAEIDLTIELLAAFPEVGRPRDELRAGVRSFKLRRFQHIIFYRVAGDVIELLRLLHTSRNVGRELT